jgi:hypothetical protein
MAETRVRIPVAVLQSARKSGRFCVLGALVTGFVRGGSASMLAKKTGQAELF